MQPEGQRGRLDGFYLGIAVGVWQDRERRRWPARDAATSEQRSRLGCSSACRFNASLSGAEKPGKARKRNQPGLDRTAGMPDSSVEAPDGWKLS